jgi:SpoIVB peptidase S55
MTRRRRPRSALAAAAATLCCLVAAAPRGSADSSFYPPEQIRPGMTGVGRTVFQGHVPEEFEVEFLGVLKNAIGPGQDMIISRLHGKNVERTGVIAGMSGSPVTLDGKLVGAISYRLGAFEKEAIAGITPIADMLKVPGKSPSRSSASPASADALLAEWTAAPAAAATGDSAEFPEAGALRRIGTPLVFSGFPESVLRMATPLFRARGFEPVQGGGGTGSSGDEYPIEPGVPVAVALISGDLSIAATGTLTHVEGKRIWAFGHPFFGTGPVDYPMLRAEIVVTYPSAMGSFKISNATSTIGTLKGDRLTGIEGEIGPAPRMLPVSVVHASPEGERRMSYQVVENRILTPLLLGIAVQASLQRIVEYSAEETLRTELRIEMEGHPPVVYASVDADPGGPQSGTPADVARDVATIFNAVYGNRFSELRVNSLEMRAESIPQARMARIGEVSITPATARAGEDFTVSVAIQPYRAEPFLRRFRVRVPPDTPKGPLFLTVSSARNLNQIEGNLLQRRFTGAEDVDDVIRFLNGLRSDEKVYLQVARRSLGAVVRGETLPALPLSVIFTLGSSRYAAEEYPYPDLPLLEDSQKTDFVLTGGRRMSIQVR